MLAVVALVARGALASFAEAVLSPSAAFFSSSAWRRRASSKDLRARVKLCSASEGDMAFRLQPDPGGVPLPRRRDRCHSRRLASAALEREPANTRAKDRRRSTPGHGSLIRRATRLERPRRHTGGRTGARGLEAIRAVCDLRCRSAPNLAARRDHPRAGRRLYRSAPPDGGVAPRPHPSVGWTAGRFSAGTGTVRSPRVAAAVPPAGCVVAQPSAALPAPSRRTTSCQRSPVSGALGRALQALLASATPSRPSRRRLRETSGGSRSGRRT
jgi:hypothetical protein